MSDAVDLFIGQWNTQRPDLDVLPLAIVSRILMLYKHLEQSADRALARFNLTLWQFDVLAALRRSGPPFARTPTQLMSLVTLSSGAMTNRIDRLESAGLVVRQPDPADGRGTLVRLTDAGLKLVDEAVAARLAEARSQVSLYSPEEARQFAALLRRMLLRFDSRGPADEPSGDNRAARRSPGASPGS